MEFEVTEIKALGYPTDGTKGFTKGPESLSLRLEGYEPRSIGGRKFTLHAVVPYSPEFATVQVGQKFLFERIEKPLNERVVVNALFPEGFKASDLVCEYYKCPVVIKHKIGVLGCRNSSAKQA